jgi:AraC family transcriptional regulator, transcriptional activator of pobA
LTQLPKNFEYHDYLRTVLRDNNSNDFALATEETFRNTELLNSPYRSYFYVVGLLHDSECTLRVGFRDFVMKKGTVTVVGPGLVRLWVKNDWKAKNSTILFSPEFFKHPFHNNFLVDYGIFKSGINHTVQLSSEEYKYATILLELIGNQNTDGKIKQGLVFTYLEFINSVYVKQWGQSMSKNKNQRITNDFNKLLNTFYQEQKEVSFYAEKLNVSAKSLSEILKDSIGRTAKQAIDEFLLMEAKSLLSQTGLEVKEIVFWLGFEDPSYFTKYFKQRTGLTPNSYRQQLK